MSQAWHGGYRVIQDARELVLRALEAAECSVVRLSNGEAYYTTSKGRTRTLCLHAYQGLPGVWRWQVDRLQVRMRGQEKMVVPNTVDGGPGRREVTCVVEEVTSVAEWLGQWLVVHDHQGALPLPPVDFERPGNRELEGDNSWTLAANRKRHVEE